MKDWRDQLNLGPDVKFSHWSLAVAIGVLIGYGWVLTIASEPRFLPPPSVVSSVAWVENGSIKDWTAIRAHRSLALAHVSSVLAGLEQALAVIGGFDQAPSLAIDTDVPVRYAVSDSSIDVSEPIALAEGQLTKAFIKSWLLQKGSPSARDSLLRLEVLSDALTAMLTAEPSLEFPGLEGAMVFPEVHSWLRDAASVSSLCSSAWASFELQGRCGKSDGVSQLSFRPLLASMLWRMYEAVPLMQRLALLRGWAKSLSSAEGIIASSPGSAVFPNGWRDKLRLEFEALFPVERVAREAGFSEETLKLLLQARAEVETAAGLNVAPQVDFAFHADGGTAKAVSRRRTHLILDSVGLGRLLPGGATLGSVEMRALQTQLLVRETCGKKTTLGELLDEPIQAKRVLFVRSCADDEHRAMGWSVLAYGGLGEFSYARPDVGFVQINVEQAKFAIRRGALSRATKLTDLLERRGHPLLGLERAEWRKDVGAFRVVGAIEAIEWIRPAASEGRLVSRATGPPAGKN